MEMDSHTKTSGAPTRANADIELLRNLPVMSITTENQQDVLEATVPLLAERLGANHGYILLTKNSSFYPKGQLNLTVSYNQSQDNTESTFSNNLARKTLQDDQGQLVQDAINNQEFFGDPSFQTFNIKSAICVPIKTTQSPLGVMYFDSSDEKCGWGENDLKLLEVVAGYVGLAIENTRLQQEKEKNSRFIAAGHASLHISHSVKNILQLIGGAVEVIDFGLRTDQIHRVKRSWDILKPNLERVRKFSLELLDFSKERHLELAPCEFNGVVQSAIDSLRAQLKEKKTKLHIRVDPEMPTVKLDGERIHELATNLILNAIDVVNEETGIVNVQTGYHKDDGIVEFSVNDNGPGIDEQLKETIFLPYESTKNKVGTGLGLAIAKQIVDQHKGRIEIESEIGKGSTFRVYLPCSIV